MGSSTCGFPSLFPISQSGVRLISGQEMCRHLWGRLAVLRAAVTGTDSSWGGLRVSAHIRITAKMLSLFLFYFLPLQGGGRWVVNRIWSFYSLFPTHFSETFGICWQGLAGNEKEWSVKEKSIIKQGDSWLCTAWLIAFSQISIALEVRIFIGYMKCCWEK